MLAKLIETLTGLYRQDLRNYTELLSVMQEFSSLLEKNPEADDLEKELAQFALNREKLFNALRESAIQAAVLQEKVCAEIGGAVFQAEGLKPYVEPKQHEELAFLIESLQAGMVKVLEMDELIIPKLTGELEALKLELHRIQGAKKTKIAYENQGQREARFIDKTK